MQLIGKYVIHKLIGSTGYSKIFHCLDPDLQAPVAIKLFAPSSRKMEKERQYSPDIWRQRFVREARILASFDHPHIVPVMYFSHLENGAPYFVMPYQQANLPFEIGRDVFDPDRLAKVPEGEHPRALAPARAASVLRQVLSALAVIHGRNMVHRDLKPANILLHSRTNGAIKLCDFGMAKQPEDSGLSRSGVWIGTLDYMAPEQRESATKADARADVYSAGALAYRLFTGRLPMGAFPPPIEMVPSMPAHVSDTIMKALRPDRQMRPKDGGDMLHRFIEPPKKPSVKVKSVKKEVVKAGR